MRRLPGTVATKRSLDDLGDIGDLDGDGDVYNIKDIYATIAATAAIAAIAAIKLPCLGAHRAVVRAARPAACFSCLRRTDDKARFRSCGWSGHRDRL